MIDPLNPIPPTDYDPDNPPVVLTRQQQRAEALKAYIKEHLPEGYFVAFTWFEDPLEYLRVELTNVVTGRKHATDITYETLLKQATRYLGGHAIKTMVDSDTGANSSA